MNSHRLLLVSFFLVSCSFKEGDKSISFNNLEFLSADHLLDDDSTIVLMVWMEERGTVSMHHRDSDPSLITIETKTKKFHHKLTDKDVDELQRFCAYLLETRTNVTNGDRSYNWTKSSIREFSKRLSSIKLGMNKS